MKSNIKTMKTIKYILLLAMSVVFFGVSGYASTGHDCHQKKVDNCTPCQQNMASDLGE